MRISRIADRMTTKGHAKLHTRVKMYDLFERATILMNASAATSIANAPMMFHSELKLKKKNSPYLKRTIPPAMFKMAMINPQAIAPARKGNSRQQLSHHIVLL